MAGHKCKEDDGCYCGIVALEPDPKCPKHGGERDWPPRCATCGRFMKTSQQKVRGE